MLIKAQINFTAVDPRGWVVGLKVNAHLDNTLDLEPQCRAECIEWIDRRKRVHGQDFKLSCILSVIFEKAGFWYVVKADEGVYWPKHSLCSLRTCTKPLTIARRFTFPPLSPTSPAWKPTSVSVSFPRSIEAMQATDENTTLSDTLNAMGVILKVGRQLDSREGWGRGFRHFIVYVCRDEKPVIQVTYSMGSAYTEEPTREDVLHSILLDSMYGRESFESFCADVGYDEDSRKAYAMWEECVKLDGYISAMFTPSELETLSELFQDH